LQWNSMEEQEKREEEIEEREGSRKVVKKGCQLHPTKVESIYIGERETPRHKGRNV
jgi:hypothetical protein